MKIYEIATGYTPVPAQTGAATEIVVEELTKAMLAQEHEVVLVDIKANGRPPHQLPITEVSVPAMFTKADVQLGLMHKLKRVAYSVCLARKLASMLKKETERVVLHFHNQYNLFFFLKLTSKKLREKALIAYTNHSGVWRLPWEQISETISKRYFQERECMLRANIVFALNQETIDNAVRHCGAERDRFVLIGNGVNTDIYSPIAQSEAEAEKNRLGLSGKRIVLQAGSVNENKGQLRALKMLEPLLRQHDDLVYAYVGGVVSEEYHQQLQQYVQENGLAQQVCYLGVVKPGAELNRLYNAADATVCASEYEGFSLVIIEALAAGTPVLISSSSPFSVGAGCIPYTPETFPEVVSKNVLNTERRQAFSLAARKNAMEAYSWKKISQDYLHHFSKMS